jgi:hypothetical protein
MDGDGNNVPGGAFVFGEGASDDFFALYGDADGDGVVSLLDFANFRQAFGGGFSGGTYHEVFDADGDGTVGLADFSEFRRNFGTTF